MPDMLWWGLFNASATLIEVREHRRDCIDCARTLLPDETWRELKRKYGLYVDHVLVSWEEAHGAGT